MLSEAELIRWAREAGANGQARAIRRAAGLRLVDVVAIGGGSAASVSRWERGLEQPRRRLAVGWAWALLVMAASGPRAAPGPGSCPPAA